jgi:demethylmenaquinone methyltransferase/2-methoxy-6-polyprenyl-1,4-benzoquinol methylase
MFDGIVDRYDALNRLISLGQDRAWRRATVRAIHPEPGDRVLDLGVGTGDLAGLVHARMGVSASRAGRGQVVGIDLSAAMLARARARFGEDVALVRGSAFRLPFRSGLFQGAVSGFVLRNLQDLEGAMRELARVMAPGGRIALLDATEPRSWLRPAFDVYFRLAAPALGALAGRRGAYQYLASSLAQIPPAEEMRRILGRAGFEHTDARPMSLGAVTLFTGRRALSGR